jgi:hypothetical protein
MEVTPMNTAPKYMVKVVASQAVIVHTADVAELMGKSRRTVRRYAQYGQLSTLTKTHKKGWHYVQKTKVTIG